MRVLEQAAVDKEDVRRMDDIQLARMGVRLEDRQNITFRCMTCNGTWSPDVDFSGKLPFHFWVCPLKCNQT